MLKKYLIFLSILCLILLFSFHQTVLNFLGEKVFLNYHNYHLATTILETNPSKNDRTYYLLGRIYFVTNDLDKSIQYFAKSIELNQNIKEYYYARGLAFGFKSPIYYDQAISDFQKYIDIDKIEANINGRHAFGAWAGYNDLAWIYFMKGDWQNAEKILREALVFSPINPWLSNMLGAVLMEQKNCNEAIIHLENAKRAIANTTSEVFGQAYSGDRKEFWHMGLEQMKKTIDENIQICKMQNT